MTNFVVWFNRIGSLFVLVVSYQLVSLSIGFGGETILDESVKVQHFEKLSYPLRGRVHATQGVVVVQVMLNNKGIVDSAVALSGAKELIAECVENARKWRFQSTHNRAIVVYVFQIRGLCELPCPSNFEFYPPNTVFVSMGAPIATY